MTDSQYRQKLEFTLTFSHSVLYAHRVLCVHICEVCLYVAFKDATTTTTTTTASIAVVVIHNVTGIRVTLSKRHHTETI